MTPKKKPQNPKANSTLDLYTDDVKRFERAVDMAVKHGPLPTLGKKAAHEKRESPSKDREKSR